MSLALLPDSEPLSNTEAAFIPQTSTHKFPHTRAQLAAFSRQFKASDSYDSDAEGDELARVPSVFVNQVVGLLVDEREDDLKELLKDTYGVDDQTVEHNVLDLMHKHRDDVAGVPFLFLTPTRRPISRPSSRASTPSSRLPSGRSEAPNSAPSSPLAQIFRRPLLTSPLASGVQATSYMTARSDYSASPSSSPILPYAHATHFHAQFTASLPASPLSSPRLLNAKASEFKLIPRPLSAASSNPGPVRSESPDLWAHSPFRASSNLAIAAPLLPDQPGLSRSATPVRSPLRQDTGEEDEDDPFDPFGPSSDHPPSFQVSDFDTNQWEPDYNIHPPLNPYAFEFTPPFLPSEGSEGALGISGMSNGMATEPDADPDAAVALLTDGMTPFDVLTSVFGSTLAPSELEEALATNAYDFDRAMAWLVDRTLPLQQQQQQQNGSVAQQRMQPVGGRVTVVPREPGGRGGYPLSGPQTRPNPNVRYVNGRPNTGGNRVCRYFVAGECLRADCRFSHDLERALCRFWLRGTCAKGENCEFLHHLPKDVDVQSLNAILARANISPNNHHNQNHTNSHNPPLDDFPVLGQTNGHDKNKRSAYAPGVDAGRTRFAAAVKKPVQASSSLGLTSMVPGGINNDDSAARREALGTSAAADLHHRSAIIAPRPSPRLRLRTPSLLPTLVTGESLNNMYMTYRSRALQLGQARNACLSRAADAWRRGDGAAAKRFSREGHDLNAKMSAEMRRAAGELVRERALEAERAVRARDLGWSDDSADRTTRGKLAGAGLGVILGVASNSVGDGKLTVEERTEAALDLHGLHANEATDVLEEFLLALEAEFFYGLAYIIVGEQKHTGTQDVTRGAGRVRLATGVREWIHRWGYPWSERDGILCVDPLTHAEE
ncbi:hypothetical protein GGU10DRAFT_294412 [Lentinula aff. detonsa]|uniref:Uncharacterized protein n=1 Tax=Lentinula aff. detonsa TaxID=2804958 RepID=A0AA38K9J8_9AGAR|nr:hypothetical protein GGU10DRAFT_294412 [Lentinula aff. detonsa]